MSASENLVEHSHPPEKHHIVRAQDGGRDIMVAVDHSDNARKAFDFVLSNVVREHDVVHIVHAIEAMIENVIPESMIADAQAENRKRRLAAKEMLKDFTDAAREQNVHCRCHILLTASEDERDRVLEFARELKPTMLVMGSRGMGFLRRAFLGSFSEYLIHHAEVPVIVVR